MMSEEEPASTAESNNIGSQKLSAGSKMPKLQLLMLIVMGGCLLVNALVSLSHAYGPDSDHNLAVHEAIDDFKKGMPASAKSTSRKSSSLGSSKIASLSCEKYGGPPNQYASEMVYWSDVPSDSKYISPLQKKRGERRQYMTFEPGKICQVALV